MSPIRRCSLALVKLRSRLLTALNLLPSMATSASENRPSCWHSTTNWRQTARIAFPLSLRKLARVLNQDLGQASALLHALGGASLSETGCHMIFQMGTTQDIRASRASATGMFLFPSRPSPHGP